MANKKDKEGLESQVDNTSQVKTKKVRNRSNCKVELLIEGKVVVFPPSSTIDVPYDFEVPNGIGLYVKE